MFDILGLRSYRAFLVPLSVPLAGSPSLNDFYIEREAVHPGFPRRDVFVLNSAIACRNLQGAEFGGGLIRQFRSSGKNTGGPCP
jgi:hypothetical protein